MIIDTASISTNEYVIPVFTYTLQAQGIGYRYTVFKSKL